MTLLDLSKAPKLNKPVHRILWLAELDDLIQIELYDAYREAYFEARQQGQLESAIEVGPFSRTQAMRLTREQNEALGRQIRWNAL